MAEVTLPQLGETVTEGTITQWFKAVGDNVNADEPLFEVSTDKVDTEVPSPVSGTVTEIRVPEGETVDVGTVIAVCHEGGEAAAAPAALPRKRRRRRLSLRPSPSRRPSPSPPPSPRQSPSLRRRSSRRKRRRRNRLQPKHRLPKPRSRATARCPCTGTGRCRSQAPARPPTTRHPAGAAGRLLSPVVRRLVNEHGLDPAAITGTGPGGRITRDDVLDHIDAIASGKAAAPQAAPPRRPRRHLPPAPPCRPQRRLQLRPRCRAAAPAAAPRPRPPTTATRSSS